MAMRLEIVERPGFRAVGVVVRTVNAAERDLATAKIPKLWKRYFDEKIDEQIPAVVHPEEVVAVYHNYENDYQGFYSLLIGQASAYEGPLPGALQDADVPEQLYLVFPPVPARPDEITRVWQEVWNYFSQTGPFQRAYDHDFELYRSKTMQLFLGVKPR